MIKVKLHTALQKKEYNRNGYIQIPYEDGLTVEKLRDSLKIQIAEVGLVLINGKYSKRHEVLKQNDTVEFYPIFGGG
jgi:molybdopterin converting factor small subunit